MPWFSLLGGRVRFKSMKSCSKLQPMAYNKEQIRIMFISSLLSSPPPLLDAILCHSEERNRVPPNHHTAACIFDILRSF